jgi:hypothetical protein
MYRRILIPSAMLAAMAAGAAAAAIIWLLVSRPADLVLALTEGDVAPVLWVVLDVLAQVIR